MSVIRTIARRCRYASLLICSAFLFSAQTFTTREYQIKAVFLFNFAQFVEWPDHAFPEANTPLVIGVLGENPFGSYLDETVRGEKIKEHPLVVQRYRKAEDVKMCHILFINFAKADQLKSTLEILKPQHILTVGDAANFTNQGGIIGFFTENSKIRIKINLKLAKETDLNISSKLLRVAEIVDEENN